jgi:predicted enzyme related to lactoylglutathione lyase
MDHDPEGDEPNDELADHVDELLASVGATIDQTPAPASPEAAKVTAKSQVDDSFDAHVDELLTEVSRSVESLPPPALRPIVEPRGALAILEQDDIASGRDFYEDVLGLIAIEASDTEVRYRIGHDSFLVLTKATPAASEGAALVLAVRDLDEARNRLENAGVAVEASDELREALGAIFVRDPSGHLLGLAVFEEEER